MSAAAWSEILASPRNVTREISAQGEGAGWGNELGSAQSNRGGVGQHFVV